MKTCITLVLLLLLKQLSFAQSGSETFTASGMYVVPEGVTTITIEVIGAGGHGGGNGSGGGGGGGYAAGTFEVTPLSTLSVTIGEAGGGANSGTTSVENLISASGGANGFSIPNPNLGGGGAGGTGSGGNIANNSGGNGGGGYWTYFGGGGGGAAGAAGNGMTGGNTIVWNGSNCLTPGGDGGSGGGAPGGNGGKGAGFTDAFCTISNPAANGEDFGGGGGGGNGNGGGPGLGGGGYCKISYCILNTSVSVLDATITVDNTFANYQWIDCSNGNAIIPGATGQSYTATQNGSYAAVVSDEFCTDTTECVDIVSTGNPAVSLAGGVMIYPTQFTSQIHIVNAAGDEWFELSSMAGQLIWNGRQVASQDFSELTTGWYLLKVKNQFHRQTFRLYKQ